MYCPYCGTKLPDDAVFCNHCGREMPNINDETPIEVPSSPNPEEDTKSSPSLKQDKEIKVTSSHSPKKKTIIKIVVGVFIAIIVCICAIGIVSLFDSSAGTSKENIVGTWKSTTSYYDDDTEQYASIYYSFFSNGKGTQTWYDINGNKFSSRSIKWSGNNNVYTLLEEDTQKSHTFTVLDDRASISYGINFVRTADGAVATPIPTSPIYSSEKNPSKIITSSPTKKPTSAPTSTPEQKKEESITRNYKWDYNGYTFTGTYSFPKSTYDYYRNLGHGTTNLAKYATDATNRKIVSQIADSILRETNKLGFNEYDKVMTTVAFVQSLPYTSDSATTGHDDYPRYPIETLVDNGGDCEDSAILTAAILREMEYGCALLVYDNHVAVGVKGGEGIYGNYYKKDGDKYFYLETTGKNWDIGEIPDKYESAKADVIIIN